MTNKTKLTAFEWYIEQHNIIVELGDNISVGDRFKRFSDIVKKAKEMEWEQINDAYFQGFEDNVWNAFDDLFNIEYYKQTYGGGIK